MITDGGIQSPHSLCSEVGEYKAAGIDVYSLTVNGEVSCSSGFTGKQNYADHNALNSGLAPFMGGLRTTYTKDNCIIHAVYTPFNGIYDRHTTLVNG